jgi:ATP-dependent helicase/nuclease subunit A
LRQRLSAEIDLLLVDEFQDTDPAQAQLVEALCGDRLTSGRLFFVGDSKQSIYRFRGADPGVFAQLQSNTPEEGRLPLTENFRSQPEILRFVNALFVESLGPRYEPLEPRRPQVSPTPAIEFLWAVPAEADGDGNATLLRKTEADWLARRIRQLLDSGAQLVWDREAAERGEPAPRAVRPGDIAILFRALPDVQQYESALRRYGLEYYLVGGRAFYAQQEVFDLLNLLRALCSPADAVALAGALRSPFFAFDDETLYWLARHPGGLVEGLFESDAHERLSGDQRERVEFARDVLSELRAAKDRLSVAGLIELGLERTGYDAMLLTEFLGERKLANLHKLVEQARSFDSSGICTLAEFVTQLDEFVSRQPHEAMAATEAEDSDVIRLMSVHQAKGLEFPVVIVPDLQRTAHASTEVTWTSRLGPLVKLPKEISPGDSMTGRDLYAMIEADEDRAETERLLYVATTRAADYLLLSSGVKQVGIAASPWMELLARRFDLETGALQGTLPPGYESPAIAVTNERPKLGDQPSAGRARVDLQGVLEKAERLAAQPGAPLPRSMAPLEVDTGGRRQFSFSELSGALELAAPLIDGELGGSDGELRSADQAKNLGTLAHALLAELPGRPQLDLESRVRHFAELILWSPESPSDERLRIERRAVELAARFRDSSRFASLQSARQCRTEVEFLLAWPPGYPAEETTRETAIWFRGFIDCLYQDAGGKWHILDYKTNRIGAADVTSVARAYELQMLLYALAVEQSVGEPPASLILSFLEPGIEHEIVYSADVKAAAAQRIDAALASFRVGGSSVR